MLSLVNSYERENAFFTLLKRRFYINLMLSALFHVSITITQLRIQAQHQEEIDRKDNTDDNFYYHNVQIIWFSHLNVRML